MFEKHTESETRDICKTSIEALEFWLRRLINYKLKSTYGDDYVNYRNSQSEFLFKTDLRNRINSHGANLPNPLENSFLDDLFYILTKDKVYRENFSVIFNEFYGSGQALRNNLKRLIPIRNNLAHARTISRRTAEQVVCYTNDIIDCIMEYNRSINKEQEYNVPKIIHYIDSLGHSIPRESFNFIDAYSFKEEVSSYLRPGQTIGFEIKVDPTFSKEDYKIFWSIGLDKLEGEKFDFLVLNQHVGGHLRISCQVITNKDWHAQRYCDDEIEVYFKVLPPP